MQPSEACPKGISTVSLLHPPFSLNYHNSVNPGAFEAVIGSSSVPAVLNHSSANMSQQFQQLYAHETGLPVPSRPYAAHRHPFKAYRPTPDLNTFSETAAVQTLLSMDMKAHRSVDCNRSSKHQQEDAQDPAAAPEEEPAEGDIMDIGSQPAGAGPLTEDDVLALQLEVPADVVAQKIISLPLKLFPPEATGLRNVPARIHCYINLEGAVHNMGEVILKYEDGSVGKTRLTISNSKVIVRQFPFYKIYGWAVASGPALVGFMSTPSGSQPKASPALTVQTRQRTSPAVAQAQSLSPSTAAAAHALLQSAQAATDFGATEATRRVSERVRQKRQERQEEELAASALMQVAERAADRHEHVDNRGSEMGTEEDDEVDGEDLDEAHEVVRGEGITMVPIRDASYASKLLSLPMDVTSSANMNANNIAVPLSMFGSTPDDRRLPERVRLLSTINSACVLDMGIYKVNAARAVNSARSKAGTFTKVTLGSSGTMFRKFPEPCTIVGWTKLDAQVLLMHIKLPPGQPYNQELKAVLAVAAHPRAGKRGSQEVKSEPSEPEYEVNDEYGGASEEVDAAEHHDDDGEHEPHHEHNMRWGAGHKRALAGPTDSGPCPKVPRRTSSHDGPSAHSDGIVRQTSVGPGGSSGQRVPVQTRMMIGSSKEGARLLPAVATAGPARVRAGSQGPSLPRPAPPMPNNRPPQPGSTQPVPAAAPMPADAGPAILRRASSYTEQDTHNGEYDVVPVRVNHRLFRAGTGNWSHTEADVRLGPAGLPLLPDIEDILGSLPVVAKYMLQVMNALCMPATDKLRLMEHVRTSAAHPTLRDLLQTTYVFLHDACSTGDRDTAARIIEGLLKAGAGRLGSAGPNSAAATPPNMSPHPQSEPNTAEPATAEPTPAAARDDMPIEV